MNIYDNNGICQITLKFSKDRLIYALFNANEHDGRIIYEATAICMIIDHSKKELND